MNEPKPAVVVPAEADETLAVAASTSLARLRTGASETVSTWPSAVMMCDGMTGVICDAAFAIVGCPPWWCWWPTAAFATATGTWSVCVGSAACMDTGTWRAWAGIVVVPVPTLWWCAGKKRGSKR